MFKSLFGRRTPMSPVEYQQHVLTLLHKDVPDEPFEPTDEALVIRLGKVECGLGNLYSSYVQDPHSSRAQDRSIREHFLRLIESQRLQKQLQAMPWEEIRPLLRPQFMPSDFPDQGALLAFAFTEDLRIGLVIDSPNSYQYVRIEDRDRWGQPSSTLYETAIANLDAATGEVELDLSDTPDRWAGIGASDVYAAVRLLLPDIRRRAVEHLGSPCFAVIPNRDVLFFWACDNSPEFDVFVRSKANSDSRTQPYPLTDRVFTVTVQEVGPSENP